MDVGCEEAGKANIFFWKSSLEEVGEDSAGKCLRDIYGTFSDD